MHALRSLKGRLNGFVISRSGLLPSPGSSQFSRWRSTRPPKHAVCCHFGTARSRSRVVEAIDGSLVARWEPASVGSTVSWVLAWPSWCCTCAGLSPCGSRSEAKVWRRQCGGKCSGSSAFFKTCRSSAHGEAPRTGARVTPAQRLRRPLDLEARERTGGPLSKKLTAFGVGTISPRLVRHG